MGLQTFRENFIGRYDGVTNPLQLNPGDISGGFNLRKISPHGGWKARKGCTLHNTTAIAAQPVKSLHQYTHPIYDDYHFISQCNSLLYDMTNSPPDSGSGTGTSLGIAVGTTPGFSCQVGDWYIYADGSGRPVIYGGTSPRPIGVFTRTETGYYHGCVDITKNVVDGSTSTSSPIYGDATACFYIVSMERLSGFNVVLGSTVNSNSVTMTVKAMRSGTLTDVSASDGTADSGKTLAVDGAVTWTASANDTLFVINRTMGYVYQVTWSGALSGDIDLEKITVIQAASLLSNKWNGAYETVTGCKFFDDDATDDVKDALGYVTNESTSMYLNVGGMTASDKLHLGCPEPATGFLLAIVNDYANTNAKKVDAIRYHAISGETAFSDIVDTTVRNTAGFGITGTLWFEGTEVCEDTIRIANYGDRTSMYWYTIEVDGTLSADCRIYYAGYAPAPVPLGVYDGCVEFKGRLILWGDRQYPNRLRYSALDRPDVFSGIDSGYSQAFGKGDDILCAINFYNELLIWKKNSVWMWEGFDRATFGSLRITKSVGLASPKTAKVVEVGTPGMSALEPRSIAIWQDTDGVYVLDGTKPKKISMAIDWLFNPEYSSCIAADDIGNLQSFTDPIRNTYHLLLPTAVTYNGVSIREVVYNYATDEWYPPWYRSISIVTGISLKGDDGRDYVYGGSADGYVMRLDTDTTDKNSSNEDVAIRHTLRTRALTALTDKSSDLTFTLRRAWPEFKAQSAGTPTINLYKDLESTGTSYGTESLISTKNAGIVLPEVVFSQTCDVCAQIEFDVNSADVEMETYGIGYELEALRLPNL